MYQTNQPKQQPAGFKTAKGSTGSINQFFMNKKWLALALACCMTICTNAQTLFSYGKNTVDARDFINAYEKNNVVPDHTAKNIDSYLQLYINSRLKIKEAYDRGYDTLPQQIEDLANLRSQIIENYMNDPEILDNLVMEAFHRSQKDIHVAHIYIGFPVTNGNEDTSIAFKKINDAYSLLKNGKDFASVAQQFSEDPSVKTNKGDIGFITVFSLPYDFENIIYNTSPGKFSGIYKSKHGYHIFKNLGERKPFGKIKAAQILLAVPPGADAATEKNIAHLADSLYKRLIAGDDFETLAKLYSNDFISASAGGLLPTFGIGQFDPVFESTVYKLSNKTVSKPFRTAHGFHIVKKISTIPVISDKNDKANLTEIRNKIQQNDRMAVTEKRLYEKVIKKAGLKKLSYDEKEFVILTDSLLDFKRLAFPIKMTTQTALFNLGDSELTMTDWIAYAQTYRYKTDGSGMKSYSQLMDEFKHDVAKKYYRNHLEDFNDDFRRQVMEFKDGNLFFEIMQKEIWSHAQDDSIGLKNYYDAHRAKYMWNESADAIIFYCGDENTASQLNSILKKNPENWKNSIVSFGEKVITDSARFEFSQIPAKDKKNIQAGAITKPVINENDKTASFAYVTKLYNGPEQRSFAEARALVLNDYQDYLEQQWVNKLRKKYPVEINQKVLRTLYTK
jgi:peptidyl-prolyl cis-trans isomerase SurA